MTAENSLDDEIIANFVLPVVSVRPGREPDTLEAVALLGTCFLIEGTNGTAMTARHVADEVELGDAVVLFNRGGQWEPVFIQEVQTHPNEDAAILRLMPGEYPSPFRLSRFRAHGSSQYMVWGYPDAILRDSPPGAGGVSALSPDLAYSEGHIRRRITRSLPFGMRGTKFFELSGVAGNGCSGAPMTLREPGKQWTVVGIYVGERRSSAVSEENRVVHSEYVVGFATRTEDLDEQIPEWSELYIDG